MGGLKSGPVVDVEEALSEMANLRPRTTGLPFIVFVGQQGGARHGPRIEISPLPRHDPEQAVTITLDDPPRPLGPVARRDLELAASWIALNRDAIEAYWTGAIPLTEELIERLRPAVP